MLVLRAMVLKWYCELQVLFSCGDVDSCLFRWWCGLLFPSPVVCCRIASIVVNRVHSLVVCSQGDKRLTIILKYGIAFDEQKRTN